MGNRPHTDPGSALLHTYLFLWQDIAQLITLAESQWIHRRRLTRLQCSSGKFLIYQKIMIILRGNVSLLKWRYLIEFQLLLCCRFLGTKRNWFLYAVCKRFQLERYIWVTRGLFWGCIKIAAQESWRWHLSIANSVLLTALTMFFWTSWNMSSKLFWSSLEVRKYSSIEAGSQLKWRQPWNSQKYWLCREVVDRERTKAYWVIVNSFIIYLYSK